jgi:hypothetical protein
MKLIAVPSEEKEQQRKNRSLNNPTIPLHKLFSILKISHKVEEKKRLI